jgi:hypothetical protein
MHNLPVDSIDLIKSSIKRVSNDKIMNCVKDSREQVENEVLKQLS